ncbi:hypothetical protein D3C75_783680 [compost metagenome]
MRRLRHLKHIPLAFKAAFYIAQICIFFAAECKVRKRYHRLFAKLEEVVALFMIYRQKVRRSLIKYHRKPV